MILIISFHFIRIKKMNFNCKIIRNVLSPMSNNFNNSNDHFNQDKQAGKITLPDHHSLNIQRMQRLHIIQNAQRIQHMQNLNNYKLINNQLSAIKDELDTVKNYFKNDPSQYVLYQIMMIKKKRDQLSKNKDILKKKLKFNFVKRFKVYF